MGLLDLVPQARSIDFSNGDQSSFFFQLLSGDQQADFCLAIHAGSSSGGAENSYVCCDAGGEDGRDGEEEEVTVGTRQWGRWLLLY